MAIIVTVRGGEQLCLDIFMYTVKSEKKNPKMKQHGDVLDELLAFAMQFFKQQIMKFIHLPSHTIILLIGQLLTLRNVVKI